jgi:hypothetical protein
MRRQRADTQGDGMSSQQQGSLQDSVLSQQKPAPGSAGRASQKNTHPHGLGDRFVPAYARKVKLASFLHDMRRVVHARQKPGTAVYGRSLPIL